VLTDGDVPGHSPSDPLGTPAALRLSHVATTVRVDALRRAGCRITAPERAICAGMRRIKIALVAAVLAFSVAACGGGTASGTTHGRGAGGGRASPYKPPKELSGMPAAYRPPTFRPPQPPSSKLPNPLNIYHAFGGRRAP
jgi:hypothetical protein